MRYHGFRSVPTWIRSAISAASSDTIEVAASRFLSPADSATELEHFGVHLKDGVFSISSESVLPPLTQGRWSKWNILGKEVILRDLPKVDKAFSWESPNFGDPSKGYHPVTQVRKVWQRKRLYGQGIPILLTIIPGETGGGSRLVARVDRVFNRADLNDTDLLLAISLLQENLGVVAIRPTDRSVEEWAAGQTVEWELLPPGEGERVPSFSAVKRHFRLPDDDERTRIADYRYSRITSMQPSSTIVGVSRFARYLGFKFRDDLVALENLDYGNALYLMYEDWEELSKRSRMDLLASTDLNYDRIVHRSGWEERLRQRLQLKGHATD